MKRLFAWRAGMAARRMAAGVKGDRRQRIPAVARIRPYQVLAELGTAFAVLMLVDHRFFGLTAFHGVDPHPYSALILLFALIYGVGAGLAGAIGATAFWAMFGVTPFGGEGDYFVYLMAQYKLPLIWFILALVVGELLSNRRRRLIEVTRLARRLARQSDLLSVRFREVDGVNRALQLRIAHEERGLPEMVALAGDLVTPGRDTMAATIGDMIATGSGLSRFRLHIRQGEAWSCLIDAGADADAPGETVAGEEGIAGSALARTMLNEPRILHVGAAADRAFVQSFGDIAVPVRHGSGGALCGILIFSDVALADLTSATLMRIAAVASGLDAIIRFKLPMSGPLREEPALRAVPPSESDRGEAA